MSAPSGVPRGVPMGGPGAPASTAPGTDRSPERGPDRDPLRPASGAEARPRPVRVDALGASISVTAAGGGSGAGPGHGAQSGAQSGAEYGTQIDTLMDRASNALVQTRYFEAADDCWRALAAARRANDFERMARIVLPLQEARRQIRQLASDAAQRDGVWVISAPGHAPRPVVPGYFLIQPPMIGLDARRLAEFAWERRVPVMTLAREPLTRTGHWPVVGVGPVVVRARVAPPLGVQRDESRETMDNFDGPPSGAFRGPEALAWFEAAGEALGDKAIADAHAVGGAGPAAYLVDDLLERLPAVPEHEKLHQALASACRKAAGEPVPELPRRRALVPMPNGF